MPFNDGSDGFPSALKLLIAGGFGVGKTTVVAAVSEIEALGTQELLTTPSVGTAAAPAPCTTRAPRRTSNVGATAATSAPTDISTKPASRGPRTPRLSASVPMSSASRRTASPG